MSEYDAVHGDLCLVGVGRFIGVIDATRGSVGKCGLEPEGANAVGNIEFQNKALLMQQWAKKCEELGLMSDIQGGISLLIDMTHEQALNDWLPCTGPVPPDGCYPLTCKTRPYEGQCGRVVDGKWIDPYPGTGKPHYTDHSLNGCYYHPLKVPI